MKPSRLVENEPPEVLGRVIGKRLSKENTRIIHQRVDATELLDGSFCDFLGRASLANIAVNQCKLFRRLKAGFLHAARCGDDMISAL